MITKIHSSVFTYRYTDKNNVGQNRPRKYVEKVDEVCPIEVYNLPVCTELENFVREEFRKNNKLVFAS